MVKIINGQALFLPLPYYRQGDRYTLEWDIISPLCALFRAAETLLLHKWLLMIPQSPLFARESGLIIIWVYLRGSTSGPWKTCKNVVGSAVGFGSRVPWRHSPLLWAKIWDELGGRSLMLAAQSKADFLPPVTLKYFNTDMLDTNIAYDIFTKLLVWTVLQASLWSQT